MLIYVFIFKFDKPLHRPLELLKTAANVCLYSPKPRPYQCSALFRGTTRQRTVAIAVDGTLVRTWQSSGTTDDFEVVDLTGNEGVSGQVVQITGELQQSEWLSIIEVSVELDS